MSSEDEPQGQIQSLHRNLEDIKTREGVIGYILRASKSAAVDIKDPSRIVDYAALSATVLQSGQKLANIFSLGDIKSIILEGPDTKILSLIIADHRLSIFMEKKVSHEEIFNDLSLS